MTSMRLQSSHIQSPGEAQALHPRLFRSLYRIRRVEEQIMAVYPLDKVQSPVHLSIGQEAISVGVCDALEPADITFGTYRGHALYLAKGGDLNAMIAELYGKATGCAGGKAGSMHLIDSAAGMMGCSAIVASTIPLAVGYALAIRMRRERRVVVSFLGDGAMEEGAFHESLNFAALRQLPILFVCENNGYAIHSPLEARQSARNLGDFARAFGLRTHTVESMDTLAIREAAGEAIASLRAGGKPVFLECHCCRWREHVGIGEDFAAGYRSQEEAAQWMAVDELQRLGASLDPHARLAIEQDVEREIAAAFAYAEASPFPEPSALMTDVYVSAEG